MNYTKETKRIRDTGIEKEFKHWLRTQEGYQETSIKTYWQALKDLPHVDLLTDTQYQIVDKLINSSEFDTQTKAKAVRKYVTFQWYRFNRSNQSSEISEGEIELPQDEKERKGSSTASLIRTKHTELVKNHLKWEDMELVGNSKKYRTLKEEDHYIRKEDFVEFLRRVEPQKARFYAFQYYGGFRWSEVKKLTPDHWREPDPDGIVGPWGGVRVEESRSKSESSRTVNFYSDVPVRIFKQACENTGSWYDKDNEEHYDNVIFPNLKQSSLNYQLGRRQNGKLYGTFPEIAGETKTLHSLRHTRVTDLVMNDVETGDVKKRTGHEYYQTTDEYTEQSVENPRKLEDYCDEHDIDILQVIEE